ncbi:MAG: methyltransferase domain-containing protein [Betaproteobacteria bacterium]|nr:methyltransferase domain-containing protein [Betaproteobacteria bacterium]
MRARILEPEWLDELPPQDPRAVRSRADLRRVNWLMGNARLIAKVLSTEKLTRIADLGSGDGHLMLRIAQRLRRPGIELSLVDRAPVVSDATLAQFQRLGWHVRVVARDALTFLREEPAEIVVANLFLHHLAPVALRELFAIVSRNSQMLAACEPRRSQLALLGCRLMWFIGANDVTRHDAIVSVRAGFTGRELSELWQAPWQLDERSAPPFSHLFVARRAR